MITKGVRELCSHAESIIETWSVERAKEAYGDDDVVFVDIRDIRELSPRGMLEFWVDPESPYAKEEFQSGKRFVFFCAGGLRSALAALAVHEMGLAPDCHMEGGYAAWQNAGGATEEKTQHPPKTP